MATFKNWLIKATGVLLIIGLSIQLNGQEGKTKKAFTPGWAVGVKVGTFGPGIEIVKSFNELVNLRFGGTYFKMKYDFNTENEISTINRSYTTTGAINLMADLNFLSFMHFTGGLLYNLNKFELKAAPNEDYFVDEDFISSETAGNVDYKFWTNKICPYAGLGFGRSISRSQLVSFSFDFGVVYHGSPKLQINANGMISPADVEEQEQVLKDNIEGYKFYPVLNFQLSFRFYSK
jgi:hypothetical protein